MRADIDRVCAVYGRLASRYDQSASRWDRWIGLDAGRRWVCERAHGRVLEVGIGTGLSLPHYGTDVELIGIDATPQMLDIARRRAAELHRKVELRVADAESLGLPDSSFDAVVFAYSLCTIPNPRRALLEARRVTRPDGALLLTEHVRSPNVIVRSAQRLLNPIFERFEADHLLREPIHDVRALGFKVEELERSAWGTMERVKAIRAGGRLGLEG